LLHPAYACSPESALDEFRDAVKALHKAGIEVILDIVLNHSAELDLEGPVFSLRGIDNRSYYWIRDDGDYYNWTGCGNTLNLSHPALWNTHVNACATGLKPAMWMVFVLIWLPSWGVHLRFVRMRHCLPRSKTVRCSHALS
jgi:hypothetical protein